MTPSWRARIKALSANPGKVRLGDRTAKSVDGEFCIDGTVRHSGEFCGPGPPDRSLPQPESVDRFVTTCRRKAGVVTLLLTVSGCAHGIHPAPPPQLPPPEVPPPQVPPPQVPATQAPERPAARLLFTATAYCTGQITASGLPVSKGVVAADPAVLPLGTRVRITGAASYNGTYWVLDTGADIRKRRLDLYIPDCAAARQFGRRSVHVTVLPGRH